MSTAIIGAGAGGLTTALLLTAQGQEVTVYERSHQVGGRLAYEKDGSGRYIIDQGPTIVLLPEMLLGILEEAGIQRERIPLIACDPMYRIHYADGTAFDKYSDNAKQEEEIERVFPGESAGFRRYMSTMKDLFLNGKEAFLEKSFLRRSEFFTWKNVLLLQKMKIHKSVRGLAEEFFKDTRLADAFSLQTLYIGGAPFQSPALYSLIPYAEHAFGIWYLKGGYHSLNGIMEQELRARGVEFKLNSAVERIALQENRTIGVEVSGQGLHKHDRVIYNGDFPNLRGLLPPNMKGMKTPAKYIPSSGCVLVYLGVRKRWSHSRAHQFFLPQSLTASLKSIFEQGRIPDDPSYYVFNPVELDPQAAPHGESVMYMLIPAPAGGGIDWEQEAPRLAERVIQDAEQRAFPGLTEAIQWKKIRTPLDAEREGLYGGGSFGLAPLLKQSGVFRPQFMPYPIQDLYTVGASVHPGGGIPIVMQGAKLLAGHLGRELRAWNA
ncbi:phytoene desaturase family protein [Paenibacillus gansuensis]|uniref:Phytoene desaturase family protein n=1 Tax=Paenibacillus gansuensis TaxID=306542 RepID=A0ABW5PFC2_9BACL